MQISIDTTSSHFKRNLWLVSLSITSLLVIAIVIIFEQKIHEDLNVYKNPPLYNQQEVDEFLSCFYKHHGNWDDDNTVKVKTGFYLQSVMFLSMMEIEVSGYVWIRYPSEYKETLWSHLDSQEKIVFPDEINVGISNPMTLVQTGVVDDEIVELYYFDKVLLEKFNFVKFPFDFSKDNPFRLKVWPNLFGSKSGKQVILVPDFDSYQVGKGKIFGIRPHIVVPLHITATFYDIDTKQYHTSFGQQPYIQPRDYPVLYYNVVFKRGFTGAFVQYFLPVIIVLVVLFFKLFAVRDAKDSTFNLQHFVAVASGGVVVILSILVHHQALLKQFAGAGTIYVEALVILLYFVTIGVILIALRFALSDRDKFHWVTFENGLLARLLYWPITLTIVLILSWTMLFGEDKDTFTIAGQTPPAALICSSSS